MGASAAPAAAPVREDLLDRPLGRFGVPKFGGPTLDGGHPVVDEEHLALAHQLTANALDGAVVKKETLLQKIGFNRATIEAEWNEARQRLSESLAGRADHHHLIFALAIIQAGLVGRMLRGTARAQHTAAAAGETGFGNLGPVVALANWFIRRRGLALGLAFAGVGIGSMPLPAMRRIRL